MFLRLMSVILACLGIGASASAGSAAPTRAEAAGPYARARLVAEHLNLAPGKRAWIALEFAIAPGWHMYWKGQNDTGMPPQIEFDLPPEYKVGEVLWPVPERHLAPGDLVDSIIHEQMTLLIGVDVPVNAKTGGTARIGVKAEWLVCKEACVLEDASLEVVLPVRDTTPAAEADPKSKGLFAAARDRLPRKWPKTDAPAKIEWRDTGVTITAQGASELIFHPSEEGIALESPLKEGTVKGDTLRFRLKSRSTAEQLLLGVLEIRREGKKPEYLVVSLPQPAAKTPG